MFRRDALVTLVEVPAFVWLVRLTQLTFGCICNPFRPRLFLAGTTWYFPDFSTPAAGAGGAGSAAARDAIAVSSPVHTAVLAAACRSQVVVVAVVAVVVVVVVARKKGTVYDVVDVAHACVCCVAVLLLCRLWLP